MTTYRVVKKEVIAEGLSKEEAERIKANNKILDNFAGNLTEYDIQEED